MTARHSGVLTWWNDEDNGGFGYITPAPPEGPVVVYRDELLRAGIRNPVVGTAVTFEHGIVRGDISGAARVQLADRPAPGSPDPVLAMRRDHPAQQPIAEIEDAAAGRGRARR
jgi:cold shock CspA family protein